jgi:hypothetical protein
MRRSPSFEKWKQLLRDDCIGCGKLTAFDGLGDSVLRILYESGLDPSVKAIASNGLPGSKRATQP